MGTSWFLGLNRFARKTPALHGFMAYYAERALSPLGAGLLALAAFALFGLFVARGKARQTAGASWALLGGAATFGLCQIVAPVFQEPYPYQSLRHVELLVPRATGYGLPDTRTAVAAAVTIGLLLARRHWLAYSALLATLALAFARVYVGAAFPAEVAAGMGFGTSVELAAWPLVSRLLTRALPSGGTPPGKRMPRRTRTRDRRTARGVVYRRPAPKLATNGGVMSARVMGALKAASEAAQRARMVTPEGEDHPAERGG